MIATLLSMLGGGFMRLLPELVGLWNKITDNKHELNMLDRQIELEKTRGAEQRQTIQVQGDIDQAVALLGAQQAALTGQMQKTGFWFVDALNFLVRPITTYFFLCMYGAVKLSTMMIALNSADSWHAILQTWNEDDGAILSGILAFYFVGRSFDKRK